MVLWGILIGFFCAIFCMIIAETKGYNKTIAFFIGLSGIIGLGIYLIIPPRLKSSYERTNVKNSDELFKKCFNCGELIPLSSEQCNHCHKKF